MSTIHLGTIGLLLVLLAGPAAAQPEPGPAGRDPRAPIREHLLAVEGELRSRSMAGLSADQRARRVALLDALGAYATTALFPHHPTDDSRTRPRPVEVPGMFDGGRRPLPVFIDEHGHSCAVAHLIEVSGSNELAASIARSSNYAYLHELESKPLHVWIERSGLSLDELAMIQPNHYRDGRTNLYVRDPNQDRFQLIAKVSMWLIAAASLALMWFIIRARAGSRIASASRPRVVFCFWVVWTVLALALFSTGTGPVIIALTAVWLMATVILIFVLFLSGYRRLRQRGATGSPASS